ncbi:2TM domain-containing protein [Methanobrevibacter sp.]|uniref:2TM domain-containing protein n=1 Tax=Methanobrevibacter sp. TaxID=66852 RepID=UPI0025F09DD4|nr:2TM domain-containing protein [Methanobrevibacter sp.]MBQ2831459.1 2TM domain-containing protein [Methanobrevibacter sp.]
MSDLRVIAERRADAKIKFYRNLCSYIIVNAMLAVINWYATPHYWWVLFPIFFWGIGVFISFLKAFVLMDKFDSVEYREQKIQKEMEKLRN